MKSPWLWVIAALLFAGVLLWMNMRSSERVPLVFAASSLRDAMTEIGAAFERKEQLRSHVRFNFAGSNVLAQQIVASAKADLYLSADERWMYVVEKAGRVVERTRKKILSNRLVIIANASTDWKITQPQDLASIPFRHLSLAQPDAVPAGRYAKAYLQGISYKGRTLWEELAQRVAPAMNVRAAIALVESDPKVVGIVYRTDVLSAERTKILFEIPEAETPPIHYVAARIHSQESCDSAERLFSFLFEEEARQIFTRHGFIVR